MVYSGSDSKRRLLITGHTGFVGSALLRYLAATQPAVEVVGLSRSEGGDLMDQGIWESVPVVDALIHLAGEVGVGRGWERPGVTYDSNFNLTLRTLEFARSRCVPVLFLSTYVYGPPQYLPIDEAHPIHCESPYARSKRIAEDLCVNYAEDFDMAVTILRPFNPYGPGQTTNSVVSWVLRQAKYEDELRVKDLRPRRDFVYVDDLAAAIAVAVHDIEPSVEFYNIGTGISHSVGEVVEVALHSAGRDLKVTDLNEHRRNEILDCYSDSSRFTERFGWRPSFDLRAGIEQTLESM